MKNYGDTKSLPFSELNGISQKTIENHYWKLYQGYVKKWQEIQEKLKTADIILSNATFSDIRELKVEESFAANAIILHEAYFDVLEKQGSFRSEGSDFDVPGGQGLPEGEIVKTIEKDFGSFDKWAQEFKALGLSSRGWVVLAYDFNDGKLKNYIADSHNAYGVWGAAPIIVLDMYEHAYFIDFGTDKKSYIEVFFQNLNWKSVDGRFQKVIGK